MMKLKQILNDDVNVLTEFCVKIVLHFQATINKTQHKEIYRDEKLCVKEGGVVAPDSCFF